MMSHVSNNVIKKQIFFLLGLFFSFSQISAMCPQTVGGVTDGEAIWLVVSRVGEASNVIQSQLCALSTLQPTCGDTCSVTFGQSDIGTGGSYTISAPGVYCLEENVDFSVNPAITINSDDVTIDLKGHYIDGGNNAVNGIVINHGNGSNVIIQNGTIQNIGESAITDNNSGLGLLRNIIIRNIYFYNNSRALFLSTTSGVVVEDFLIEDCHLYNSGFINVDSFGSIFRNLEIENYLGFGLDSGIFALNTINTFSRYVVIEDSVLTSSFDANASASIFVSRARDVVVKNCLVQGCGFASGFSFDTVLNVSISDCIAQECRIHGFDISAGINTVGGTANVTIERCIAQNCGNGANPAIDNASGFNIATPGGNAGYQSVKIVDCVAENCLSNGFRILGTTLIPSVGATFRNCSAIGNSGNGFLMFDNAVGSMQDLFFDNCSAIGNGGSGFAVRATSAQSVDNIIFRNCIAQNNIGGFVQPGGISFPGDGFGIGTASGTPGTFSGIICQGCIAENNAVSGFNFVSTTDNCKIIDCCALNNVSSGISNSAGAANIVLGNSAFNNGVSDITGVSDPTLLVSRTFPGALAGSSRWTNAIS